MNTFGNTFLKLIDATRRIFQLEHGNYNDMKGFIRTGLTGASKWNEKQVSNTGFIFGFLRNNSGDFHQIMIQVPHTRQMGSNLGDIHEHFVLDTAATAGQTIVFDVAFYWLKADEAIPAIAGWTSNTVTYTVPTGGHPQWHYGIFSFFEDVTPPVDEGYGGILLIKVTRGNGTYTGEWGIVDADAHSLIDRLGSIYRFSDTI